MNDHDHDEENEPPRERARATSEAARVEEQADSDGAEHLRHPVHHAVEGTGADVEKCAVVVVELCKIQIRDVDICNKGDLRQV
jgi:hypothetical protein